MNIGTYFYDDFGTILGQVTGMRPDGNLTFRGLNLGAIRTGVILPDLTLLKADYDASPFRICKIIWTGDELPIDGTPTDVIIHIKEVLQS